MPEIPTRKELGRILWRMDVVDRARLRKMARAGAVAEDAAEAALVAAVAREELRQVRWVPIIAGVIIFMETLWAVFTDDPARRWMSVAVIVLIAAFATPKVLRRRSMSSLTRAERLNRELAMEGDRRP